MMESVTSDDAVPASTSVPASGTTVLRPSRAAYRRAIRANLWIAVPVLLISVVRIGLNPWLLPVFVIAIGVTLGGVLLYFARARVEFGGGNYRAFDLLGRVTRFTVADIGTLVTVVSLNSGSTTPPAPQLIITRPDGSKLLRLRGRTWEVEQFTVLAHDLIANGAVNDAILEPITTAQLRLRYPRVVGWWEAHPIAFGLIVGIGLVALAMIIVIAVFAASIAG
jgi:hypothetical protein